MQKRLIKVGWMNDALVCPNEISEELAPRIMSFRSLGSYELHKVRKTRRVRATLVNYWLHYVFSAQLLKRDDPRIEDVLRHIAEEIQIDPAPAVWCDLKLRMFAGNDLKTLRSIVGFLNCRPSPNRKAPR